MTVEGPVPVSVMGQTLVHEHLLVDFIGAAETGYHRWDREAVIARALPFLNEVEALGLKTFFELTPAYVGRDPFLLQALAARSNLRLVTNTGYYGARDNRFIPDHAWEMTAEELASLWIAEYQEGIEESGVRPGFIKIAVERDSTLSELHRKLVTAAAITHLATGLTIVSHTGPEGPAFAQLDLLKTLGVSPSAFVWTHAQQGTLESFVAAAEAGAWVSLDHVSSRPERIQWYVETLSALKAQGHLSQVLISHDSGWYRVGEPNGGAFRGYTAVFEELIPALRESGFTREDIHTLIVKNPQRAFRIRVRAAGS